MSTVNLMGELHRVKKNEARLMELNRELKRKLSTLISEQVSFKKDSLELSVLQKKTKDQELCVDRLKTNLENVKMKLKNEETQRAQEKSLFEQKIVGLENDLLEFRNKFTLEKELNEREQDHYHAIKKQSKMLTLNVQTLKHEVQELIGYKSYATRKIDEQMQLLKIKEKDLIQTNLELQKANQEKAHFKDVVKEQMVYKEKLDMAHKHAEKLVNDIKKQETQADAYKRHIHRLTRETMTLTRTIEDLTFSKKTVENQFDRQQVYVDNLREEAENHKKETMKQRSLILHLETELNNYGELKRKLQNKEKEINRLIFTRDQEIVDLRNLITESENHQRIQIIQKDAMSFEKKNLSDKLSNAQAEISLQNKTIQELKDKTNEKRCEIETKNAELVRITRELHCVKNDLINVKTRLSESKTRQQVSEVSTGKDKIVVKKTLAKMVAENKKLKKELQHYSEVVMQQQQKINVQEATKVTQEHMLKEYEEEVKFLRLQNERLEHDLYLLDKKVTRESNVHVKSRRNKVRDMKNPNPYLQMMYGEHRKYQFFGSRRQFMEEKYKESMELRLDGATKTIQKYLWLNRDLTKKAQASQGLNMMYESKYKSEAEENQALRDELRKVKLDCKRVGSSKYTCLPPISSKRRGTGTIEDQSGDKCKSEYISRHTRFPLFKSQCRSEDKFAKVPLPPITDTLNCRGRQIGQRKVNHDPPPSPLDILN
ncbi:cilia- and flagella-associated protein 58-like [Enoplosus armatus]|uniref:cilia- and flagella-associated protein 58-like n=1 Tax=Enoplosus armatus TaxID=215367 RepID=UPI0039925295